jgi:hypothetical protein
VSREKRHTAPPLTLRTDAEKMGHITALSRRLGVSKNDVVNILLAESLARVMNGEPLSSDDQATADSLVAAALAVLHADSEEARRP